MIHNLLTSDYRVHNMLAIIGVIAFTLFIQKLFRDDATYVPEIVEVTGAWGIFTVWAKITEYKAGKLLVMKTSSHRGC